MMRRERAAKESGALVRKTAQVPAGKISMPSSSRRRPRLLLVPDPKETPARIGRMLEKAGYRVEICKAERLFRDCDARPSDVPSRTRGKPAKDVGLGSITPLQWQTSLHDHHSTISAVLKACSDLSPGIQAVSLLLFDPARSVCLRLECQGPMGREVPEILPWSRYPLLRHTMVRREAVYLPDISGIPRAGILKGRKTGGLLLIPLYWQKPVGVLCLSHAREQMPDAQSHAILLSLARALDALLENVVLFGRLSVSETRYRSILNAAPFLIALVSPDGDVLEINPKLIHELRRQGFSISQVVGKNILRQNAMPEVLRALLAESLRKKIAVTREKIEITAPRGSETLRIHALPLKGEGYSSGELLVIGEIITRYQALLDEAERTERLAAIGRVAASLAHEINNPLQALRSHLELIRSYPLSDEEREQSFRILEREVERLDETTRRVLGFARPAPEILQPVSVTGMLEQALALSRNYLHNQQVEIVTKWPESLPPVMASAGQLIQVFLNIILNASHAMKGKGRLEVRARPAGDQVIITFVNNGPPIAENHLAHIFEPFFTTRSEGTGLGLSISHAILQRHKGNIRAANLSKGRGVVFSISLPFTRKQPPVG